MGVEYNHFIMLKNQATYPISKTIKFLCELKQYKLLENEEITILINPHIEDIDIGSEPDDKYLFRMSLNEFLEDGYKKINSVEYVLSIDLSSSDAQSFIELIVLDNYFDFDEPYAYSLNIYSSRHNLVPTSQTIQDIVDKNKKSLFDVLDMESEAIKEKEKKFLKRIFNKHDCNNGEECQPLINSTVPYYYQLENKNQVTIIYKNAYSNKINESEFSLGKVGICIDFNKSTPNKDKLQLKQSFIDILINNDMDICGEFGGWN